MKLPCITSELANNALCAINGKNILTAITPEEYCSQIISLLENEEKSNMIGEQGHLFVTENYNWDINNEKLNAVIRS